MTYAAEPYAHFVQDLLTSLTGGVIREQFVYLDELQPFRLAPPGPVLASTLRVHGERSGEYHVFRRDVDFVLAADSVIEWSKDSHGVPLGEAQLPDPGTTFFASYDYKAPPDAAPLLTDRNPGSVTRLLAESFAREYAVLSRQLAGVYEAGFVNKAKTRDLDQLAALVGVTRRTSSNAVGSVVFSRRSVARGDVVVPAGTRLSTGDAPPVAFETTAEVTLKQSSLSVEAPIQSRAPGAQAIVPAGAITVMHRPILGIDAVANPQATQQGGNSESDEALRGRIQRALPAAGKATPEAIIGSLGELQDVRDKDIRIAEDHILRPGIVTVNIAVPLDESNCARAIELIEEARPAGVRVVHNLDSPTPLSAAEPGVNARPEFEPEEPVGGEGLYFPVVVSAVLVPTSPHLTSSDRVDLQRRGQEAVQSFVREAGIGEPLIYNALVAQLMGLEGVLDVNVEMYPAAAESPPHFANVHPPQTLRPTLDTANGGAAFVHVGGELLALDLTVEFSLQGFAATLDDQATARSDIRAQIAGRLRDGLAELTVVSVTSLTQLAGGDDNYSVESLTYTAEYVEAGVRIKEPNVVLTPTALERPWVRRVNIGSGV